MHEEKTLQTQTIFSGRTISLQVETVCLPNGLTATREIVRHPGSVAIMAIINGRMLVIEQYRKTVGRTLLEIPAGKLEHGEDPATAARRELQEETGFRCGALRLLTSFYTAPGFADQVLHLFVAEQLVQGDSAPDEDEYLTVSTITLEEAERYVTEGRIADAKTLLAIYLWKLQN